MSLLLILFVALSGYARFQFSLRYMGIEHYGSPTLMEDGLSDSLPKIPPPASRSKRRAICLPRPVTGNKQQTVLKPNGKCRLNTREASKMVMWTASFFISYKTGHKIKTGVHPSCHISQNSHQLKTKGRQFWPQLSFSKLVFQLCLKLNHSRSG